MDFQVFVKNQHCTNWQSGGVLIAVINATVDLCIQKKKPIVTLYICTSPWNTPNYDKDTLSSLYGTTHKQIAKYCWYFWKPNTSFLDLLVDTNYLLICADRNAYTKEMEDWVTDKYLNMDYYTELTFCTAKNLKLAQIPLKKKSLCLPTSAI